MRHDEHKPTPSSEPDRTAGFEHSDAQVRPLVMLAVGTGVLTLLAMMVVAITWRVMAYETNDTGTLRGSPLAGLRPLPPSPRLQITPANDLKDVRDQEHQLLSSYGWVERDKGVVRIPIDRAMDILAQRGLPPGKPETPAKASGPAKAVKP